MAMQSTAENRIHDPKMWVDLYGDDLYRFALARVNDSAAAEDLVQETFLAALSARRHFQGRSSEKTWLIGILKHKIVDHYRRSNREQPLTSEEMERRETDAMFNETGQWKERPGRWSLNPSRVFEQHEFFSVLEDCLSILPERTAEAFVLREMKGLTTQEICNTLNISATNCWVMLYRARMQLRRCIEKRWFAPAG